MTTFRIETYVTQVPAITARLLHWGFTYKVKPQFNHSLGDINSISDVTIITIEDENGIDHIKACIDDQLPQWADFVDDIKCVLI